MHCALLTATYPNRVSALVRYVQIDGAMDYWFTATPVRRRTALTPPRNVVKRTRSNCARLVSARPAALLTDLTPGFKCAAIAARFRLPRTNRAQQ